METLNSDGLNQKLNKGITVMISNEHYDRIVNWCSENVGYDGSYTDYSGVHHYKLYKKTYYVKGNKYNSFILKLEFIKENVCDYLPTHLNVHYTNWHMDDRYETIRYKGDIEKIIEYLSYRIKSIEIYFINKGRHYK